MKNGNRNRYQRKWIWIEIGKKLKKINFVIGKKSAKENQLYIIGFGCKVVMYGY